MDTSMITDSNIERSETTRHITGKTLVDQDAGTIIYESTVFRDYFDRMLESFDSFLQVYILLILKGNGVYEKFPDGSIHTIDFKNIEHAIGISSFGNADGTALDFMKDLLDTIQTNPPSQKIVKEFTMDEQNIIEPILITWNTKKVITPDNIEKVLLLIQKYKDVDDLHILEKMEELANILVEVSYNNKRRRLIKYIPSKKRETEIIDDLIAFIDQNLTSDEKRILFSMDFQTMHSYEEIARPRKRYIDQFDEKSMVLGKITGYLSSKYDINKVGKQYGFDIPELIERVKLRYYDFYAEQIILRNMSINPKTIKKAINSYIEESNKENTEHFQQTMKEFITRKPKVSLSRSNIKYYLKLLENKELNIETMILLYNMGSNIDQLLKGNEIELEKINTEKEKIESLYEEKKETLMKLYNSKSRNEPFDTYLKNILRGRMKKRENPTEEDLKEEQLEEELIILYKEKLTIAKKYEANFKYNIDLETYKEKMDKYYETIEKKIKDFLIAYCQDLKETIDLFKNNNMEMKKFILILLHKNYLHDTKNKIGKIFQKSPVINSDTAILREIMGSMASKKLQTKTIEYGAIKSIKEKNFALYQSLSSKTKKSKKDKENEAKAYKILKTMADIGYEQSENDVEFAIKLLSEIKDRRMINLAKELYQNKYGGINYTHYRIIKVLNEFKHNVSDSSIIYLVHALMHTEDVQTLLETRFNNKKGTEFNYDKIAHKCLCLASLDEIVTSRVKLSESIGTIDPTLPSPIVSTLTATKAKYPYIMYLGGEGETKTLVYFETKKDSKGNTYLTPVHSIKYEVNGKLSYFLTAYEVLQGKYMPQKRKDTLVDGIPIEAGESNQVSKRR